MQIIARQNELALLKKINQTREPAFIAVYGRRRVGKTHLIREFFSDKGLYFELSGMKNAPIRLQLKNFNQRFSELFYPQLTLSEPKNWREAFQRLTDEIKKIDTGQNVIIFFDELPWLASKRSFFIENLDYFWNSYWSRMKNIRLVVCGSAAAWMLDNLIHATGGLHNRITRSILLKPFNLRETKEYIFGKGIRLSDVQLLEIYMAMGGIPFYLSQIEKGKSSMQNINDIAFTQTGLLYNEFDNLFNSLFDKKDIYLDIIEFISKNQSGVERQSLLDALEIKSGGTVKKRISELEAAGFIEIFIPYGKKHKGYYLRIIDEYTLFYLQWVKPMKKKKRYSDISNYWQLKSNTAPWHTWAGYAFECVCFKHVSQIRQALGLGFISAEVGSFRERGQSKVKPGAQIDLLFDRQDKAITLCEIKYTEKPFSIDNSYARDLSRKVTVFTETTKTTKQIFLAMITVHQMKKSIWSDELISQAVTLANLFA
jgi:predicted AAA+ superfamily ATPase